MENPVLKKFETGRCSAVIPPEFFGLLNPVTISLAIFISSLRIVRVCLLSLLSSVMLSVSVPLNSDSLP